MDFCRWRSSCTVHSQVNLLLLVLKAPDSHELGVHWELDNEMQVLEEAVYYESWSTDGFPCPNSRSQPCWDGSFCLHTGALWSCPVLGKRTHCIPPFTSPLEHCLYSPALREPLGPLALTWGAKILCSSSGLPITDLLTGSLLPL